MKKIIIILLSFFSFTAFSQTVTLSTSCASPTVMTVQSDCTTPVAFAVGSKSLDDIGSCSGSVVKDGYIRFTATTTTTYVEWTYSKGMNIGIYDACGSEVSCQSTANFSFATSISSSYYLRPIHNAGGGTGTGNICIHEPIPTCDAPTSLAAGSITASGASLSWTENGTASAWDIEWGADGFTQGTGTTISATSSNPYSLTGLTASTDYDYYVRANCGGGLTSTWVGPFSFSTIAVVAGSGKTCGDANVIASLPFNQTGFNTSGADDDYSTAGTCDADYMGGDDYVFSYTPSTCENVNISLTNTGTWVGLFVFEGCPDASGTCVNAAYSSSGTNPSLSSVSLYSGITYYFIISTYPSPQTTAFDINVTSTSFACPTCNAPSDLDTVSVGGVSANLSWTENGTATTWDIEMLPAGNTPTGTPTLNDASTNPYTYAGLSPTTSYDYYVRADCGGMVSSWSGPFTFTTESFPSGSSCADPYVVSSLPFSADNMTTAGFGDDFDVADGPTASGGNYLTGDDYVMTYTPSADECVTFFIDNMSSTSYGSMFLMDGCPSDAGTSTVVRQNGSSIFLGTDDNPNTTPTGFTDVPLTGGVTYYLVFSTYAAPSDDPQSMTFDLDIFGGACPTCTDGIKNGDETNVDCGGSCPNICLGSTCVTALEIPSLPYRVKNATTEGMGDDYDSGDACGSTYMNGNDFVYKYTATAADTCVTIAVEELWKNDAGIFLLDDCPDASGPSANCIASTVDNGTSSLYIYGQRLTAGEVYYIVVSGSIGFNDFNFSMANYCGAPDCGTNPTASDLCENAPLLGNLEGFCGTTSSSYTASPTTDPTEFCASIENNSWYKFVADSTTATVQAHVSNCVGGRGIQIHMYSTNDCINYTEISNCWDPKAEVSGAVTATGLIVGNTYYIMVDGEGGDVCNYTLNVESGVQVGMSLVSISELYIKCNNGKSILSWKTLNNSNDVIMFVEKSKDGINFNTVGNLKVKNYKSNYEFIDSDVFTKGNYYRIKQVDSEGKTSYTKIVKSYCNSVFAGFQIFPNPAKDIIVIKGNNVENSDLRLFNSLSQSLALNSVVHEGQVTINVKNIERGVYFLNIQMDDQIIYRRIVLN